MRAPCQFYSCTYGSVNFQVVIRDETYRRPHHPPPVRHRPAGECRPREVLEEIENATDEDKQMSADTSGVPLNLSAVHFGTIGFKEIRKMTKFVRLLFL